MMRLYASVSLEYDTLAVETYRTWLEVPNARLGARRALEATQKAFPNRKWRSVVIVLEKAAGEEEGG